MHMHVQTDKIYQYFQLYPNYINLLR